MGVRGWLAALVTMWLLLPLFFLGERFEVNDGKGHDGVFYVALARDFDRMVFHEGISRYRIQRVAVPALIHYGARVTGTPLTDANVLEIWRGIDVLCVCLTVRAWFGIAGALALPGPGVALGWLCLVANTAVLKWSAYYADLLDMPALLLGTLAVWAWLARRRGALAAVTVVAAFTWPTAIYIGALLLAAPRADEAAGEVGAGDRAAGPAYAVAGAAAVGLAAVLGGLALGGGVEIPEAEWHATPSMAGGIAVAAVYVFAALSVVLRDGRAWRPGTYRGAVGAVALALGVKLAQMALSSPAAEGESQTNVVAVMIWSSAMRPGAFLVAHASFYGPWVLVALLWWPRVCAHAWRAGPGIALALAFAVPITIASESRQLVNLVPLFVPFVVQAALELGWGRAQVVAFGVLAVAASKVWLTINPDWVTWLYQLNLGPWFRSWSYRLQGGIAVAAAVLIRAMSHR